MFSDAVRKPRARARATARLVMAAQGEGVAMRIAGAEAVLLPEGALWLEGPRALIVSDLHFEKATAYAARGHLLPPYDTRATLQRLAGLLDALAPAVTISLGDAFHDRGAPARLDDEDRGMLQSLVAKTDWVWIEGNHDPEPPQGVGGRACETFEVGGFVFRHEPTAGGAPGEVSGHLHPCARVASRAGSARRRCFATDGERLVMPAFGALTGGLNVRDAAFAPLFPAGCTALMLGRTRLYPAPFERLIGD